MYLEREIFMGRAHSVTTAVETTLEYFIDDLLTGSENHRLGMLGLC